MISVRTDQIISGVLLVALLIATAACDRTAQLRRAPAVQPAPTAARPPAAQPVPSATTSTPAADSRPTMAVAPSVPAAAPTGSESRIDLQQPQEPAQTSAADAERVSGDDPRAVIDWLLNRSSTR
jgi:hypothetical protein